VKATLELKFGAEPNGSSPSPNFSGNERKNIYDVHAAYILECLSSNTKPNLA
jgi:hypothetical protein